MTTLNFFKWSSDDWYPSHPGGLCHVHVFKDHEELPKGYDRIVVGGDDDLAVAYEGPDGDYILFRILEMEDVTNQRLRNLGFESD